MEHYRYYVERVPLFYQFAATEEPTERPTWIPSFGPTNEPTEQIIPSLSPSVVPSVVPYSQIQFAEPWQMTVVLSVITSTITTIVLICAGTYCLWVRSHLKKRYLRSIASESTSGSSVSSLSEEESREEFVFSDVYADAKVDGFFESPEIKIERL